MATTRKPKLKDIFHEHSMLLLPNYVAEVSSYEYFKSFQNPIWE